MSPINPIGRTHQVRTAVKTIQNNNPIARIKAGLEPDYEYIEAMLRKIKARPDFPHNGNSVEQYSYIVDSPENKERIKLRATQIVQEMLSDRDAIIEHQKKKLTGEIPRVYRKYNSVWERIYVYAKAFITGHGVV